MAKLPPLTRQRQEVERRIHAALEEDRAKQSLPTTHVRLSSIGKCPRALWALRQGVPEERSVYAPPMGRALMTFSIGHHVEDAVVSWLKSAGYEVEEKGSGGSQWEVCMDGGVGIGHLDGNVREPSLCLGEWMLLEIKTAKAKKFEELIEAGSYRAWNEGYYDQITAYMGASCETEGVRSVREALVCVVNKDDSRLYSEVVAFDPEHYRTLVDRAWTAMQETIPDRPPAMKSQYCRACKYCDVNKWCWGPMAGVEFDPTFTGDA